MNPRLRPTLLCMRSLTKAAAAALGLTVCALFPAIAGADPPPAPGPAPGPKPIDADGTYTVGSQIAPGSYSTAGPVGDGACHYKLTSGDNVIDNVFTKKPQVVTVGADATAFKTDGCQPWQPTDCSSGCGTPEQSPAQILGQLGGFLLPRVGSTGQSGAPPATPSLGPAPGPANPPS
jgi:hypothetical protein